MNLLLRLFLLIFTARRRPHVPALGPCVTSFRVWPNDLDVLRHMNNGRYFSILDLARVDLMVRSGLWAKLNAAGLYPVVVDERMRFRRPLKLFDRYTVRTTVIGWDEKHIAMEQIFFVDGKEVAGGIVKARMLRKSGGSVSTAELMKMADVQGASPLSADKFAAMWADF
jgi:acyl-CoA thioesterase FadM